MEWARLVATLAKPGLTGLRLVSAIQQACCCNCHVQPGVQQVGSARSLACRQTLWTLLCIAHAMQEIKAFVEADPYVQNGLVPSW